MLGREAAAVVVDTLTEEDFFHSDHREAFKAIQRLHRRGEPVEVVTVADAMGKDRCYACGSPDVVESKKGALVCSRCGKAVPEPKLIAFELHEAAGTASSAPKYVEIVKQHSRHWQAARLATQLGAAGQNADTFEDELLRVEDGLRALRVAGRPLGRGSEKPTLASEALHGLTGEVVDTLLPQTEADPAGLALTFLTAIGAMMGQGPHAVAGSADHPARLFTVLVGPTARARKGTTYEDVCKVLEAADESFIAQRTIGGLGSGEGLIAAVEQMQGIAPVDHRALVHEPEFSRMLKVRGRDGSTLSEIIRETWDRGRLRITTRKEGLKVDGAHVALVAHITMDELKQQLTGLDAANGFANRFLFVCVNRSKKLPHGGRHDPRDIARLGRQVDEAVEAARGVRELRRTPEAERLWESIYLSLDDDAVGLFGGITSRAEAQMLRLSVAYAALDGASEIDVVHVKAARAVWSYAEDSAAFLFGDALGNPDADRLLDAVRSAGASGLGVHDQHDALGRHNAPERLEAARRELERRGLIETIEQQGTIGRPRRVSRALR